MVSKKKAAAQKSKGKGQAEEPEPPPNNKGGNKQTKGSAGGKGKQGKAKSKSSYGPSLDEELALLGLRIKNITADGNCFFRALGDQLKGDEGMHTTLRQQIINYMVEHEDDFAPFVEDDEKFAPYISRMRKDGAWAGCMEVVAASRALPAHLTIYQEGQPRWAVPSPVEDAPMLHLSYHDGMHYNSVRNADDFGRGPPQPIVLKPVTGNTRNTPGGAADGHNLWGDQEEARVLSSTACERPSLARAALAAVGGNVDSAIEYVIEQLAKEDEGGQAVNEEEGEGDAKEASAREQGDEKSQCSNPTAVQSGPVNGVSLEEGTSREHQSKQEAEGEQSSSSAAAAASNVSQHRQHDPTSSSSGMGINCSSVCNGGVLVLREVVNSTPSTATDVRGADSANGGMVELPGCSITDGSQLSTELAGQQSQQQQQQQLSLPESLQTQSQDAGQKLHNPAQSCCDGRAHMNSSGGEGEQQEPQQSDGQAASKKGVQVSKKNQWPEKQPNRNKPCPCGSKIKYKNCCLMRKEKAADLPQPAVQEVGGAPPAKQLATIVL